VISGRAASWIATSSVSTRSSAAATESARVEPPRTASTPCAATRSSVPGGAATTIEEIDAAWRQASSE
jgi:hypothetical protein